MWAILNAVEEKHKETNRAGNLLTPTTPSFCATSVFQEMLLSETGHKREGHSEVGGYGTTREMAGRRDGTRLAAYLLPDRVMSVEY